jgi:uncharacterized protein YrzB (UPF0473 family)
LPEEDQFTGEEEYEAQIVVLEDEEGAEHKFEIVDALEHAGQRFVALIPFIEEGEVPEDIEELIILEVIDEDGDDVLVTLEDDDLYDEIFAIFRENLKDEFDIEVIE